MSVTLKQLEILYAIVVAGSISRATRPVGLSQPTLSQQLAKFEEVLGTQLIVRGRFEGVKLTAAGEYWFRQAADILGSVEKAKQQHTVLFDDKNLALRFGTTPSLRGRLTEIAARAALELDQIARFDLVWATTSTEIVEMINTRRLNCGVVSSTSVEAYKSSFHVEHLWHDRIVWTVPVDIPDEIIARTLASGTPASAGHEALSRYVEITLAIPWAEWSENWYRHNLPFASPYFGCMTHPAAVDIVAAGIATCHSPLSLILNLPQTIRNRIKIIELDEFARDVVLIMPKHLLSLTPFKAFYDKIGGFMRATYGADVIADDEHRADAPDRINLSQLDREHSRFGLASE